MSELKVKRPLNEDELDRIILEDCSNDFLKNYVYIGDERTLLTEWYLQYAHRIENFEIKDDDVWLASYPKTGTTWSQAMIWMIMNNLDFEEGKKPLMCRFPFLEYSSLVNRNKLIEMFQTEESKDVANCIDLAANKTSPRLIKTHLPYALLPKEIRNQIKTPKIIYIWRNPKDTCVSYYHHSAILHGWKTDLKTFAELFMADKVVYGSFWRHVFGYWNHKDQPNMLFLKYEDLKADLSSVIEKVAKFLGKTLTDQQIQMLVKHLSFDSMKKNDALNNEFLVEKLIEFNVAVKDGTFLRSGVVGKYKEELTTDTVDKLDRWIRENVVGTSLENEYDFGL